MYVCSKTQASVLLYFKSVPVSSHLHGGDPPGLYLNAHLVSLAYTKCTSYRYMYVYISKICRHFGISH